MENLTNAIPQLAQIPQCAVGAISLLYGARANQEGSYLHTLLLPQQAVARIWPAYVKTTISSSL